MTKVGLDKEFSDCLQEMGLRTFSDFTAKPVGKLLSEDKNGRELRLLQIKLQNGECQDFYLKRLGGEPFSKLVQMFLFGHLPASGPIRELQLLNRLKNAGFAAMRPVAFGEKRRFGWPRGGFLLVEGVKGIEVADFYLGSPPNMRRRLFLSLGKYFGRLHTAGFFQPVRLKDLFFLNHPSRENQEFDFVLIDRETSKPWTTKPCKSRCLQALTRTTRRTLRDGFVIGHGEAAAFCRGYHGVTGEIFGVSGKALRRKLFLALRKEFRISLK